MSNKFKSGIDIRSILNEKSLAVIDDMNKKRLEIVNIPISDIDSFPNHPYYVKDDEAMQELVESIKNNGILTPITVRKKEDGRYELISGHRRRRACELAELKEIPALIIKCTDEDAVIQMVDANLQRPKILPSEKAFAYKMKLDAMKRQGKRNDISTSVPLEQKLEEKTSRGTVAEQTGESESQIRRYIRLTYLIHELLQKVDNEILPFRTAVEISYLSTDEQKSLDSLGLIPSLDQAERLKKYSKEQPLNIENIKSIMKGENPFYTETVEKKEITETKEIEDPRSDKDDTDELVRKLLNSLNEPTSQKTEKEAEKEIKEAPHKEQVQQESEEAIPNWGGEENNVMKGYVLYALQLIESHCPECTLSDEQKDSLMRALSWAADDMTASEAYDYYIMN